MPSSQIDQCKFIAAMFTDMRVVFFFLFLTTTAASIVEGAQSVPATGSPARHSSRRPLPPITLPVMFNTPEADQIVEALQVFPPDNPWNEDISQWPVHSNSKN